MEARINNYSATVVKISNLTKHPNADRLQVTNIFGNTVIVGLDTKIGDVGLFFPLESQLGLEYAEANNLLRRKDENGKTVGGLFDDNRRVRAQTLRGQKSMGFFMPIDSLNNLFPNGKALDTFKEGDEIEEYLGKTISQKYIPVHNRSERHVMMGRQPRESRIVPNQFHFHKDTAQLGRNIHQLSPTDLIAITWKLHGTSAIAARVRVKRNLSWFERLLKKFIAIVDTEYDYIYASRRVVKNEFQESKDHYYKYDLWSEVGKEHFYGKLHTGETVYYEIVGYTKDGSEIQKAFDYGCSPDGQGLRNVILEKDDPRNIFQFEVEKVPAKEFMPQHKVFVYRITQTAVDGSVVELQWNQVKERCNELGVNHVPEINYDKAENVFPWLREQDHWHENFLATLKKIYVDDQNSIFCENHVPEEGICVRKEGLNLETFKLKSFRFLEFETKALDKGEVDIETEQTITDGIEA